MSSEAVDVVVVGAGIIGLATTWQLARRGLRVCVVDPEPAQAATWAAAGMLAPVSEVTYGETALLRFAMESLRRYSGFVEELERTVGMPIGLRREGTMIVATDAGDREMLVELHAFQSRLGLSATMLTSRECRALEPMLAPEIRCGLHVESDHSIDNRRLATALLTALGSQPTAAVVKDRVTSLVVQAGRIAGVQLERGSEITSAWVVLAAGAWSGGIAGLPEDARPPVRPVKGEILRLRSDPRVALAGHSIRGLVNGHEIYLVPRADGEVVVGATVEDAGFETSVRAGAVRELLRDAHAVVPTVDEFDLVESRAGLRPGSPDNAPMIGPSEADGLVVATGHHRNGILLAPLTADLVSALIQGSVSDLEQELLSAVTPQRFVEAGTP